jgi:DNA-directed RNA polymerase subunit H (RpoH/RPB5)
MSEISEFRNIKEIVNLVYAKTIQIKNTIVSTANDNKIYIVNFDIIQWDKISPEYHRFIFSYDELQFNILDNIMVPIHSKIVNVKEFIHILKQKNVLLDDLPTILSYDPVVRRMNFCIGDIICCRCKKSNNEYYRVVRF